jgi:hypothetical protein
VARINSCVNRWAAAGFCVVLTALLCVVGTPIVASAQVAPKRSILMVVDTSGSMAGSRIEQARNAHTASIDALSTEDSAGLRRYSGSCGDGGQLLVAPGRDNRPELRSAVAGLSAGGGTPTPDALRAAAGDFPSDATERILILISDGESTCGDPCPIAADLNSQGVSFKAFTVGFQATDQAEDELACIARVTGGEYFSANDTASLQAGISAALSGQHCQSTGKNGWKASADSGWAAEAVVSDEQGLMVKNLRLGPRLVARNMSISWLSIDSGPTYEAGVLTASPKPGPLTMRTHLVNTKCYAVRDSTSTQLHLTALYAVDGLVSGYSFLLYQDYRFDSLVDKDPSTGRQDHCEATETVPCVRFWPTVSWTPLDANIPANVQVEITQRIEFDPDASGVGAGDLIADSPDGKQVSDLGSDGRLKREGFKRAIDMGKTQNWDNWHQTGRPNVGLPGIKPLVGKPGCSECAHAHWTWDKGSNFACSLNPRSTCWSTGKPQILPGSKQTAWVGWAKYRPEEAKARPFWTYIDNEKLDSSKDRPVLYWVASTQVGGSPTTGVNIDGRHSDKGDSYWPQLGSEQKKALGGNGSMFILPARLLAQSPSQPDSPSRWSIDARYDAVSSSSVDRPRVPAGSYLLPVTVKNPGGSTAGPFYLRVKANSAKLVNADPVYLDAPGGRAGVRFFDDEVSRRGQRIPTVHFGSEVLKKLGKKSTMTALLAFDQPPQDGDISLELSAAPDGPDDYIPVPGQ